jgi:hypothetical protein
MPKLMQSPLNEYGILSTEFGGSMKLPVSLLLAGFITASSALLLGQSLPDVTHAPDGGIRESIEGVFVPAMAGAPFSTKETVFVTKHLADGSTVTRKYFAMIARDSQGRLYRERRNPVAGNSDSEPYLYQTYVSDPDQKMRVTCSPASKTCWVTEYRRVLHMGDAPLGPSKDGKSYLTRESLGTQTLQGLTVEGTRETVTYAANTFGNDKPLVVTKEFWYSPELQVNLKVIRNDPREGTQTLELTELSRAEPPAEQFAAPQGYKMVDVRAAANRAGDQP